MRSFSWFLWAFGMSLAVQSQAQTVEIQKSASQIFSIQGVGVGARAVAMGEAYTALADDASSPFWNPAGLVQMSHTLIGFSHTQWLLNSSFQNASLVIPFGGMVGAAQVSYAGFGDFERRDDTGALQQGLIRAHAFSGGPSIAGEFGRVSAGAALNFHNEVLETFWMTGLSADFGALYRRDKIRIGASLKGLLSATTFPIRRSYGLGFAYTGDIRNYSYVGSADLGVVSGEGLRLSLGGEIGLKSMYFLRAGFKSMPGQSGLGFWNHLSFGFGIALENLTLDYALVSFGDLGLTHRISFQALPGKKRVPKGPQ